MASNKKENKKYSSVNIIGGGLAGSEAAWQLANRGIKVNLFEMRNLKNNKLTFAHKTDKLAELVCSNSFRSSDSSSSAVGILHRELRKLNSLIFLSADKYRIVAGTCHAIDREPFSQFITEKIKSHPNINVVNKEVPKLNENENTIIATGPLTSDSLAMEISNFANEENLHFFDAIAPVCYFDSIDMSKAWMQSRYDKVSDGVDVNSKDAGKDYINCPLNKEEYYKFIKELIESRKTEFKEWEKHTPYFEGCLPIEVMAKRGKDTLRFGPMKPVGLTNPNSDDKPYAVVQLRKDNKSGSLWNIVGFQTKMLYGEQKIILRKIPGLEKAEFARFGGIHRNTFINSPKILNKNMTLKNHKNIMFAGQITGVEGYVESTAMGLLAGIFYANKLNELDNIFPNNKTAIGSLLNHITLDANVSVFQPMNANFGLFADLDEKTIVIDGKKKKVKGKLKKEILSKRAEVEFNNWLDCALR